jgi:metal-responsive CopG/Arc/MetJ family transcriptional regulator
MKVSVTVRPRTRGRPPTGGGAPVINARMPRDLINAVDDWAAKHSDGSRSEAIRRLVERALKEDSDNFLED